MVPPVSQAPEAPTQDPPIREGADCSESLSPISLTEQMQRAEGGAAGLVTGLRRQRLGVLSMVGCCLWGI